jgi:hypothetical protein
MKLLVCLPWLVLPAFGQSTNGTDSTPSHGVSSAAPVESIANYRPPKGMDRLKWFRVQTAGPLSRLAAGSISSGRGTMLDKPKEYGPHWEEFGQRYGVRLTGLSTGTAMEAGLGMLWGEDPRYFPSPARAFGPRLKCGVGSTFVAPLGMGNGIQPRRAWPGTWGVIFSRTPGAFRARTGWGARRCGCCGQWWAMSPAALMPSSGPM